MAVYFEKNGQGGDNPEESTQIVRYSDGQPSKVLLIAGIIWCVFGGVSIAAVLELGGLMAAYGMVLVLSSSDARKTPLCLVATLVPAIASCYLLEPDLMLRVVLVVMATWVISVLAARGRLSFTKGCLVIAVVTAVLICADVIMTASQGIDIASALSDSFDQAIDSIAQSDVTSKAQLQSWKNLFLLFWPSNYVASAAGIVICSWLGGLFALRRVVASARSTFSLAEFDLPLWPVGLLIAGIALLALSMSGTFGLSDAFRLVGANVLLSMRFVFGLQGLATFEGVLRRKGVERPLAIFLCVVMVCIDMATFVLVALGLVDIWANFRHLQRGVARPSDATNV